MGDSCRHATPFLKGGRVASLPMMSCLKGTRSWESEIASFSKRRTVVLGETQEGGNKVGGLEEKGVLYDINLRVATLGMQRRGCDKLSHFIHHSRSVVVLVQKSAIILFVHPASRVCCWWVPAHSPQSAAPCRRSASQNFVSTFVHPGGVGGGPGGEGDGG